MTTSPPQTRLTPVPFAEWDEQTRATLLQYLRRPELYLSGAADAPPMPVVMELFAHHVPLSDTFFRFTDLFVSDASQLSPKLRELLVLRVAWRSGSGYEWVQHRRIGESEGLTEAQLRAVPEGAAAPIWNATERALLRAVDEMIDSFAVSDETWDVLTGAFEAAQLFELLFVIGGYLCLALVLNSLGLRGEIPEAAAPTQPEGA